MTVEVKSTNLSLLREIIEGKFDEIIDCTNVIITNKGVLKNNEEKWNDSEILKEMKEKRKNLNKRRILNKRKQNLDFYLNGNSAITREWLRTKKLESDKRKVEIRKQKKEERLRSLKEKEDMLNREVIARDAYDRWLQDDRKIKKINFQTTKDNSGLEKRSSNNLEVFNTWLKQKENRKIKTLEVISAKDIKEDSTGKKISSDCNEKLRNMKQSKHKFVDSSKVTFLQKSKTLEKSNDIDENMKNIIKDLRKKKISEIERSKRRVDSGLFMKREKFEKNKLKAEPEEFVWKLISDDNKESNKDECKKYGDSRSRVADKISHEHLNPFVENIRDKI